MKIANRFRVTLPAALAAVLFGGSAIAAPKDEPIAEISTSLGDFAVRLDAQRAPITVANFIRYTDEGFYDGTIFHRVIDGFMVQGGGFTPDLKQKRATHPAIVNEARGGLLNQRGTIAMARTTEPQCGGYIYSFHVPLFIFLSGYVIFIPPQFVKINKKDNCFADACYNYWRFLMLCH